VSAGSGPALVRIERPVEADLRNALIIEQANSQMLRAVVDCQVVTIDQQNRLIARLRSRSQN
jgi:hypothetical protein